MGQPKLNATINEDLKERLHEYFDDQPDDNNSAAIRRVLDEGLRSMGYEPTYSDGADRWLRLTRGMGSVLGLTALILFGVGSFLPAYSRFGLGMAAVALAFLVGAEVADRHGEAILSWLKDALKGEASHWGLPENE